MILFPSMDDEKKYVFIFLNRKRNGKIFIILRVRVKPKKQTKEKKDWCKSLCKADINFWTDVVRF